MTAVYTRLNQALAGCKEKLSISDDWYDACALVSNILTSMGRFEEASDWHAMALDMPPDPFQFHERLTALYLIQERWEDAIDEYKQLLEINPQYIDAHRYIAQIYAHVDDVEHEIAHWYEFLTHKPQKGTAEGHCKLAQEFERCGQPERAASCYQRAIVRDNQYWSAYHALAELQIQQQQWQAAAKVYQQLLEKDASQVEVHHKLGKVWIQAKCYDQAIATFKEINQLEPKFAPAYLELVKILMELERWDEVISTCRSTISFVEELPWAYSYMGRALVKKKEDQKAIACYQKVGQLHGWEECQQNDYEFTEDTFSHQIPTWRKHLQPLIEAKGTAALQIGSQQGMTTCWLLDTVLTDMSDELFCLDHAFSSQFDRNINRTSGLDKIVCMEGSPLSLIKDLPNDSFDLIVIQDRRKQSDYIHQEIQLCWPRLKNSGLMIIKGYGWHHPGGPEKSPKTGVDEFLKSIQEQFDILVQAYQLIIKKKPIKKQSIKKQTTAETSCLIPEQKIKPVGWLF